MSTIVGPERSDRGDERQELLRRVAVAESEMQASHERESELGRALADSEAELAAERAALVAERGAADALRADIEGMKSDAERAARAHEKRDEQDARPQEKLEARVRKLESALTEVKGSASWRVTSPLRRLTQGEGRTPQE